MPAELHWLAVGAFSTLFTAMWLYIPRRLSVSTLLAAAGWSWMTVTGGSLVRYTETGAEIALEAGALQYLTVLLALLSLLALLLHQFGHYPPTSDQDSQTDINNVAT